MSKAAGGCHLILGGLGNVGRQLQRALATSGKRVVVLDRPNTNATHLLFNSGTTSSNRDSTTTTTDVVSFTPFSLGYDSSDTLKRILEDQEVCTVYSLVTPDVQHGTVQDFQRTNVDGVADLVLACQEVGTSKLVYASSSSVMNLFIPHHNANEDDTPLPPMDSYKTCYDRTKRIGEDIVRQASNARDFSTLCLRFGAILSSHKDFALRQSFQDGSKQGKIYAAQASATMDWIAASDVADAMICAGEKLEANNINHKRLAGTALFCTKGRGESSASSTEILQYLSEQTGWKYELIPPMVISMVKSFLYLQHSVQSNFRAEDSLPGVRPDLYIDIANYEQTFDNTKAHQLLGWTPKLTWQQAIDQIIQEYHNNKA